jgi:hypothetical protein
MVNNPFEVTKAVDFTDAQIEATWVDWPGGGFAHLADPRSPMPRFLVGGKGGGRTHLLRYFSYPLQRLRYKSHLMEGIRRDGYVGIYFRCGGLNSSRFANKGQEPEAWAAIFSYYTEVWLGRLTVDLISDLLAEASINARGAEVEAFVNAVIDLFDVTVALPPEKGDPLGALLKYLHSVQRQLDIAVNNAALTHNLEVEIGASPGRLVFGVPGAAVRHLSSLSGVVFAYLLDEYENLTIDQQRYVNTLIREKQLPATFLVGSRLYGLRTHETLSAGEENRQGSEYDLVVLEDTYRSGAKGYGKFCENIVQRRIQDARHGGQQAVELKACFEEPIGTTLEERASRHLQEELPPGAPRPWLERLQKQLQSFGSSAQVLDLFLQVQFPESPLHEKFAILLLYRDWADGEDLSKAALRNRKDVERLLAGDKSLTKISTAYGHQRRDLYAQLLKELGLPQEYHGFDHFVRMSGFLPRNLIVVLKQVTRWSLFLGEQPFGGQRISLKAQREGVREASAWFLGEAKSLGKIGDDTQRAVRRLGGLFGDMRFSDKPVEVGCSTLTTDRQGLTRSAAEVLDEAVKHSLILEIPNGRRERNTGSLQHKYQLNPMLAPLFGLSLARRGQASLSAAELNAIFDPSVSDSSFGAVKESLLSRMRAPFRNEPPQGDLFE